MLAKILSEPFRLFFVLGTLCAYIGVLFWPIKIFEWGLFSQTTSRFHSTMQIYGFIFAFIVGFITTAVPRLTKTRTLNGAEFGILLIDYFLLLGAVFYESFVWVNTLFVLLLCSLIGILSTRFFKRKRNPPETFVFLPVAFMTAIMGSLMNLTQHFGIFGNKLVYEGFILFLLLGIGGFLIRSILGWAPKLPENQSDSLQVPRFSRNQFLIHLAVALSILASFFIEYFAFPFFGQVLRAVLVTAEVMFQIKIHRKAQSRKLTAVTLQISLWLLVLGCWAIVIFPVEYAVDVLHLTFVGGFALSTMAVATRVIFSHCGYSHLLQKPYPAFTISIVLMLIGLLTRIVAVLIPDHYFNHLGYAAMAWVLGLFIWTVTVLSKSIFDTVKTS